MWEKRTDVFVMYLISANYVVSFFIINMIAITVIFLFCFMSQAVKKLWIWLSFML